MFGKREEPAAATMTEIQEKMKKYKYKCEYAAAGCNQATF